MKKIVKITLLFFITITNAQQKITLQECYDLVEKNYPIAKQINLLQQKSTFEINALKKAKLPKIDLNAQATYQSAVTQLPISLPNMTINTLDKEQYRTTVDISQLIYNGGLIKANTKLKDAQTLTQQQLVAVNLYQIKSRINYSFMMILLFQDERALLLTKQSNINSKITEVQSGIKNGAILSSSKQVLQAELLKLQQVLLENSFQQLKEVQNLAGLTKTTFDSKTILEKPNTILSTTGTRPELKLFDLQQAQIEVSKEIVSKAYFPKLNAFGQAGYGNPGLNMWNNSFEGFFIVGLKLNWNVVDWNKSKVDKRALEIAKEIVFAEKETFELNNQMQLNELQSEITKMKEIIETDSKIIEMREKVIKVFDSQFRNGVITSSEYLTELDHLFDAKTNQKIHETQLELAKINYKNTLGTN